MIFALPLGHRLHRAADPPQRRRRRGPRHSSRWSRSSSSPTRAAVATTRRVGEWLLTGAACAAGLRTAVRARALRARPAVKATLLGTTTGILFGLGGGADEGGRRSDRRGGARGLTDWHLYALIVVGYVSMTFNQMALTTGVLAPALAASMADSTRSPASSSRPRCSRSRCARRRRGVGGDARRACGDADRHDHPGPHQRGTGGGDEAGIGDGGGGPGRYPAGLEQQPSLSGPRMTQLLAHLG